jgi:Na+/melibiose symporter-like transporter
MVPLLYYCIVHAPTGKPAGGTDSVNAGRRQESFFVAVSSVLLNKPFLIFMMVFVFAGAGLGMWFALVFIFVDAYLGLGDKFALVFILTLSTSTITLGVWSKLASHFGKKIVWALSIILSCIGVFSTSLMVSGESGFLSFLLVKIFISLGFASFSIIMPSLLADIIDYGTWKSGANRAATYFSIYTLMTKANMALGGALGLAIAGWYGFDPASNIHTEESIFGLRLAIAYIPAFFLLIAIIAIALFPINARRRRIIQRSLESRSIRTEATFHSITRDKRAVSNSAT